MGTSLSKQQLENIKNYKYNTNDWTYMDLKFNHFWEFCVNCLSKVSHIILSCFNLSYFITENRTESDYVLRNRLPGLSVCQPMSVRIHPGKHAAGLRPFT